MTKLQKFNKHPDLVICKIWASGGSLDLKNVEGDNLQQKEVKK